MREGKNGANLAPTLWRTCRVLANPDRLRCLKAVLAVPGRTVEDVATVVGLTEPQASLALRALQSRGILSSRRRSRWAHYYPEADASVVAASQFLSAAKSALIDNHMSEREMSNAMRAYTHPRRIAIVRALAHEDNLQRDEIGSMLGISREAMIRHLRKLKTLGVVRLKDETYSLAKPSSGLAESLRAIILA